MKSKINPKLSRIPKNAKKVFGGIIFDVYQWQQKMFDGSFSTFEMLKRSNSVDVIATQGDKILLSHQSQPTKSDFYSVFGGRAEGGEEPLITAKRELLEESGLESDNWELLKVYEPIHKIDWQIHLFVARNCKKTTDPNPGVGEKIETVECGFDEFIRIVESEKYWVSELVLDILRMKQDKRKLNELRKKIFGH